MPVHHAIWRVGENPQPLTISKLASEQLLEKMILNDPTILSDQWMIIGHQENTLDKGRIDLLAIAPDASLILIELKRDRTPREVVAQALDYASWVDDLTADRLSQIYEKFSGGGNLGDAFQQRFNAELEDDAINKSHQIIIVAAELDPSTERIVDYLSKYGISINVLFFKVFQYGDEQFLSRTWLIDPGETQTNAAQATATSANAKEPWNGEFYVSFGDSNSRVWEEARRYGFISAGGGSWYSQTLKQLQPGNRVWVKIPATGYVGVGIVQSGVEPAGSFTINTDDGEKRAMDVLKYSDLYHLNADDPDKSEYFVPVKWLETRSEQEAVNEVGFFGNQNTVCKPTTPKWRHTVEKLKLYFKSWDIQV
ncbi:nuclease [Klebsiella quasipneumoniae]|uniref:nuclease n=1 Tax=Klebsiella quasipneumoniae TaxID=1463165 RepID=UPI00045CBB3F|nr:nuclease [Klebsiella quasipneumoniae]MBZ7872671.1 nuclease [Klebsiella quasipneumoniae]MCE0051222.1 nuclease [Klebsiella quasipneumoniae subsp. quasipneumoniae]MCJ1822900.1 nuclease [Klebsiella quasipneumoniae subsp. quasipneumoniae]PLD53737.1 nuclease [Klebsiella quasipneumoniae]TBP37326.1 nuclease [Klebsiella quasipneumoniae subsp. quasipneumoniae]